MLVAQWIERRTTDPKVVSSSLARHALYLRKFYMDKLITQNLLIKRFDSFFPCYSLMKKYTHPQLNYTVIQQKDGSTQGKY